MKKEITQAQREAFIDFWSRQREAIKGRMSEKTLNFVSLYTQHDNVGYEFGQIAPGKQGQWDLFHELTGPQSQSVCDENEAMIACGLTASEVAEVKRREYLEANYVNPDDSAAVLNFERLQRMSPEEHGAEILRLEQLLARS